MPQTTVERPAPLVMTTQRPNGQNQRLDPAPSASPERPPTQAVASSKGFGGAEATKGAKRKKGVKRGSVLSKDDWGPLGKHPDVEAIIARQRLHLPLSGRLSEGQVNQAWKRCAAQHHPDRGGEHDTMQLVNGARDLLLGRDLP
ncbi:MAG: hypothetical protein RLZZ117_1876 [Cyanobacteriota bacterium]